MKTGILCHGRHVLANNWELHQWGDKEKGLLGQILKTLLLSYQEQPNLIIFGTGASEKDGLKESEYTLQYMMDNFDQSKAFPQFAEVNIPLMKDFMYANSIPETESQNTREEIEFAGRIFADKEIERVIIVSNPDHISRCMQLAHQVYQQTRLMSLKNLFGAQSEVGYNGTANLTSRIIEMPHRGDDPSPDLSRSIGKYFGLPTERKKEFVDLVEDFLQ